MTLKVTRFEFPISVKGVYMMKKSSPGTCQIEYFTVYVVKSNVYSSTIPESAKSKISRNWEPPVVLFMKTALVWFTVSTVKISSAAGIVYSSNSVITPLFSILDKIELFLPFP